MVLFGDADLAERHRAELARHDHAADARDVGPEAEHLQIEHQLRVIVERRRHVHGTIGQLERVRALLLGVLNALLDVADGIEILAELAAVAGAQRADEPAHFLR